MGLRTISGNLAADPEQQAAGRITITKFVVVENTGEYRDGKFVRHEVATPHHVEARFELGAAAAETLRKGYGVTVSGQEHTESWESDGRPQFKRVLEASAIAVNLTARQRVTVHRDQPPAPQPAEPLDADWAAPGA